MNDSDLKDAFKDFCTGSHSPAYQMSAETGSPGRLWVQTFLNFRIEPKRLGLESAKGRSGLSVQMERDY